MCWEVPKHSEDFSFFHIIHDKFLCSLTCFTRWPSILAELTVCASLLSGLVCTLSKVDGQ